MIHGVPAEPPKTKFIDVLRNAHACRPLYGELIEAVFLDYSKPFLGRRNIWEITVWKINPMGIYKDDSPDIHKSSHSCLVDDSSGLIISMGSPRTKWIDEHYKDYID